ncbi:serine O-acetyltransferase EpsC [Daejeonella oryzae]|uniref:serine O-acetyltransferase EpsC n=1 Tax=Daejeonella oryzae TaxID=1122943 RepID=UPI00040977FB|nr:serine O-acetyltransferase EpsC [Daejeonella oryzae]
MDKIFLQHIYSKQKQFQAVPSNETISRWASDLICLLFPEQAKCTLNSIEDVTRAFADKENELTSILNATTACQDCNNHLISETFFERLPELYRVLTTDINAIFEGDPAAKSEFEVIRTYPGFLAISFYRLAHLLLQLDVPLLPRLLTEFAHSKTGIDIHPGAKIDESLYIDHGTGIVIGETTEIGKHVKLYQGVTLGALSVNKTMANIKRHPTVEDHVIIYSGATILGGETVIGHHSLIGGNVWLTKSVQPHSTVYHMPSIKVIKSKIID